MIGKTRFAAMAIAVLALGLALGGCGEIPITQNDTIRDKNMPTDSIFGEGGLMSLSIGGSAKGPPGGSSIGVNTFLWRASLDTVAFMPLSSADPFGGVIITDWYSPPESPNERFKINVFIMDQQLRADGVRASVFRQRLDARNQWTDSPVDAKTATELENAILTRARQLRISQS
jgi:hypothetical protein